MVEADHLIAEQFALFVLEAVFLKMIAPKLRCALGNGVDRITDLPRAGTSLHAAIREGGEYRTRFGVRVRIIQMIVREAPVKKNGLLDQSLTQHLGAEIKILLRPGGAQSDMVETFYQRHRENLRRGL